MNVSHWGKKIIKPTTSDLYQGRWRAVTGYLSEESRLANKHLNNFYLDFAIICVCYQKTIMHLLIALRMCYEY